MLWSFFIGKKNNKQLEFRATYWKKEAHASKVLSFSKDKQIGKGKKWMDIFIDLRGRFTQIFSA